MELNWDVTWHAGYPSPKHDPAPEIQVHWVEPDTAVLRQNKSVHFEAPFMFLLFGRDHTMLIDTGATPQPEFFPLRRTVDELIAGHRGPGNHPLLVAHTHGHGDHRAADAQFADRPQTTVVGHTLPDVQQFYGFDDWPHTSRAVDLGSRMLDVIPGPGHHTSATVFYDRATGLLLTGDSLYPGRIYVEDWAAFTSSVNRLTAWTQDHPVSYLVGCHIEMSASGEDYPMGMTFQPEEPPVQMPVERLDELYDAVTEVNGRPGKHQFRHFQIWT